MGRLHRNPLTHIAPLARGCLHLSSISPIASVSEPAIGGGGGRHCGARDIDMGHRYARSEQPPPGVTRSYRALCARQVVMFGARSMPVGGAARDAVRERWTRPRRVSGLRRRTTNVLFLQHPFASVESLWEYVGHLRIWRVAAEHCRGVLFDPRGSGCRTRSTSNASAIRTSALRTRSRCSTRSGCIVSA